MNALQESTAAATGLAPVDWALIGCYAFGTLALGYYYGRKQSNTEEYFSGSGRIFWPF